MPFETFGGATRRVAVIGGGISGLGAAHLLSKTHTVVLFEAERRLGGHARTVVAGRNGDQPVDTGFIVFNRVNYPNLVRLFEDLDVPIAESDMSFGASFDGGRFEYALRDINALTAQKFNVLRPGYLRMLRDILKFNREASRLADDPTLTIRGLLERLGTGRWFCDYYILPFSGAIWSTPKHKVLDFPAQTLVQFFFDARAGGFDPFSRKNIMLGRIDEHLRLAREDFRADRVDIADALDLVAEELKPYPERLIRRPQFYHIAANAELPACKVDVVALILQIRKPPQQLIAIHTVTDAHADHTGLIVPRAAQAKDARHARHDNHIVAAE